MQTNLQFFGGRGASAGIAKATTLDDFLGKRGLSFATSGYVLDKIKIKGNQNTVRQRKKADKDFLKAEAEYQKKRESAIREYNNLKQAGKIREKTSIERYLDTAKGNPDNQSTQAARRLLEKKGIDWRTGKKIKR